MVLSDLSIKRPVFATVVSLMLMVLGLAAYLRLPVREYPAIDPPIISISTVYRGASAEVVESRITEIIESSVSGIEGVKTVTSSSRDERSSVTIEFELSRDIDEAANDVRDKIARNLSRLPDEAEQPRIAKVDSDARAMLWLALASDRLSILQLTDYAERNLKDRLSLVPGVANVIISGERRPAMRIWLDRKELAARNLTVQDVETALRRQNVELPSGRLESRDREFTVRTDARLVTVEGFRELIVADRGGYQIRLGELARVERGAEDERSEFRTNGVNSIGVGVTRQSTANTLAVAEGVRAEMDVIRPSIPPEIDVSMRYDESIFIKQSIYEVFHALAIAVSLVIGVIFIFLRSLRATIIPAIAIPVSITASFMIVSAFGFSINVLTLLALVLAIGIVVDDAIVVLENVHRRIDEGEPPLVASFRGSRQIAFAVVSTTLVLIAVFVPISFLEGRTGRLFTEFGIALAASVLFSGLVALTLTPMMCSKLLVSHEKEGRLYRWSEGIFTGMRRGYGWLLQRALNASLIVVVIGATVSAAAYLVYIGLPKEFAPIEDRGIIIVQITAPEGASLAYTRDQTTRIEEAVRSIKSRSDVDSVLSTISPGFERPSPVNRAFIIVRLKPWSDRKVAQQEITKEIFPALSQVPGVRAFAINPPSLGQSGFQAPVQVVIGGPDYDTVKEWRNRLMARAAENPRLLNIDSNFRETRPQVRVAIDRKKAADLGISIEDIGRTLEVMLGSREIGTFIERAREYSVIVQADADYRARPSDLTNIFVRGRGDQLVPLSNLVTLSEGAGPQELTRVDRLPAITVQASLAADYPLGEALEYMEGIAREELPTAARISYQGLSREFKEASASLYVTFGLALLIVFLVLAAQFESWIHPFIILLTVPLAVTGGLVGLFVTGISLNVYSQIGMILLIGLMAKNGILIVEFANQLRDQGRSIRDAVVEAAQVRLRPILMTTIATIFGAVPLAFASGAGAESRAALGIVIIGGMALATVLTLFIVPVFYLMLARFTRPSSTIERKLRELLGGGEVAAAPRPAPDRQLPVAAE